MPRLPLDFFAEADPLLDLFEAPPAGPGHDGPSHDEPESLPPVIYCPGDVDWGSGAGSGPCTGPGPGPGPGPRVVWGWPTLRRLRQTAGAWVYAETRPLGPKQALLLALALEARPGGYSWREMDRIVAFCDRFAVEIDSETSRAVIGDGGLAYRIERYRALPALLRGALDQGEIDIKTAEGLESLASKDSAANDSASEAVATAEVLEGLLSVGGALSHSNRRKLLTIARELLLSRRLEAREILAIIEAKSGAPRGSEEILRELRRRRYPELTSMTEQLEGFAAEHLKGSGVRLEAPPNFEGRRFSVSFDFADAREFSGRLAALRRAEENLEDILDLL